MDFKPDLHKKEPRCKWVPARGLLESQKSLTLAKLLTATRTVQTNFLTLNFTCVTGYEPSRRQRRLKRCIIVNQSTCNAVTNCSCLS